MTSLSLSVAQMVKNPPAMWETWVQPLGWEDPLEEGMATHSSILAWRIPWTEEPGGLQSMGSQSQRLSRDEQRKPKPKPKPSSTQHEPKLPRNGEAGTKLTDQLSTHLLRVFNFKE